MINNFSPSQEEIKRGCLLFPVVCWRKRQVCKIMNQPILALIMEDKSTSPLPKGRLRGVVY